MNNKHLWVLVLYTGATPCRFQIFRPVVALHGNFDNSRDFLSR